jgi:hypothetical protein
MSGGEEEDRRNSEKIPLPPGIVARRRLDGSKGCSECAYPGPWVRFASPPQGVLPDSSGMCIQCGTILALADFSDAQNWVKEGEGYPPVEWWLPTGEEAEMKMAPPTESVARTAEAAHLPTPLPPDDPEAPIRLGALIGQAVKRKEIIEGILAEGLTVLAVGKPMSGKSWFAGELAVALASGTPFMGKFKVPVSRNVLIVDQDSPTDILRERLRQIQRPGAANRISILSQEGLELDKPDDVRRLGRAMLKSKAHVVIIDSLVSCVSSEFDENRADSVRKVFKKHLKELFSARAFRGRTLVVLHHLRKGPTSSNLDNIRGSGALVGEADVVFEIYGFGKSGRFVVKPVWKRVRLTGSAFVAEVIDDEDGRKQVRYVEDNDGLDPLIEDRLKRVVAFADETGSEGSTVRFVRSEVEGYLNEREVRDLLDLAVERGLLVRRSEARNRFRFWTPENAPDPDPEWPPT